MSPSKPFFIFRKRAARFALYASLAVTVAFAVAVVPLLRRAGGNASAHQPWQTVDFASLPEVQLLQGYVRIDTSETTGDELAGARFLAKQLAAAGIEVEIEQVGPRRANLYAWLRGADPRPLVLHNHIDVEPVRPPEWSYPPFGGVIRGPWIFGRGTFDMKSVAIAQLAAMIDLKKSGAPLGRSVLFLATSSEERGSRLGVRRILKLHPELVRSFWAVLTEGGVVEARDLGDIKFWGTEVVQKRYADLHVCSGDRAQLEELRAALLEIGPTETDLRLLPEVGEVLRIYGPTRDRDDLRALITEPEKVLDDVQAFRKLPPYLRSMLRNEAVPFRVEEAPGGGYSLLIKYQLLPDEDLALVKDELVPPWLLHGLSFSLDEPPAAHHGSPSSHPAFQGIQAELRAAYPKATIGPYFLAWTATDARFFREAGVPAFGFSPFPNFSTDTYLVDRANERFGLPGFVEGVGIYRQLVRRLVSDR